MRNRLAFDQLRLESLDRKAVQRRGTIQQNRVARGHFFKDVPYFRRLPFDQFLGAADGVDVAQLFEAPNDKWLEQNQAPSSWANRIG